MHSDTKNWNYCNENIERIMQLQEISSLWNGEKMKYKALALDLDGTLINSEKKLSTQNKKAVMALTALGYSSTESLKAVSAVEITEDMDVEEVLKAALKHLSLF